MALLAFTKEESLLTTLWWLKISSFFSSFFVAKCIRAKRSVKGGICFTDTQYRGSQFNSDELYKIYSAFHL